jgi:hypothetical protein
MQKDINCRPNASPLHKTEQLEILFYQMSNELMNTRTAGLEKRAFLLVPASSVFI